MKAIYYKYLIFFFFAATILFLFIQSTAQFTKANNTSIILRLPIQGTQRISTSRLAKITVYDKSKQIAEFPEAKMDNINGLYQTTFSLQNPDTSEFYAFLVKPSFTVGKIICATPNKVPCNNPEIILTNNDLSVEDTTEPLFVGDLNSDGNINGADASLLFAYLGKNDSNALLKADLNADGSVDAQDYSLLLFSLGKRPVQPTPIWINSRQNISPTPLISPTAQTQPPTNTPIVQLPSSTPTPQPPSPTSVPTLIPSSTPTPTPSPTPAPTQPPQIGTCHAIKPSLAGGGAYDLKNGESSECTCTMGVCAQAKCSGCKTGTCECGDVPLQMPPTNMNCSGGAKFSILICTK